MPLFMDIHTVDSAAFTVEDVVKAHMEDLAIEEKFGVKQIKYWVNVEAKTLFCLMKGPSRDACNEVHKESHGNTACNIIEVSEDEFNLYLGKGKSVDDLAHTNSGELDTGYRTILLLSVIDFTGEDTACIDKIHKIIDSHNGVLIIHPENEIMVSFILASDALICALNVRKLLSSTGKNLEYNLTLVSGRPVDEKGENLFEETKKKAKYLCSLRLNNTMYLDADTKELSDKERPSDKINPDAFIIVKQKEFIFLFKLFEVIKNKLNDPTFISEDLYESMGLSKSKTYRKIKALTGIAPNQLLQEIRLRNSLKSLKQNDKTISEIVYDSGFNSPAYYAQIFRRRFNVTPTLYIKISKNRSF
ncbi:MAG: hypothetical protein CVV24_10925 [Ignavibacteriae bacterium HGW-Ignavibacteriae-3]|nr:MAG: hypothetical protein CVV24_10925 [Ignavibacteriae bacterium HGW-Ignavibacteriae-3]